MTMIRLPILLFITTVFSQQQIELPMKFSGVRYSPAISKPEEILGHKVTHLPLLNIRKVLSFLKLMVRILDFVLFILGLCFNFLCI